MKMKNKELIALCAIRHDSIGFMDCCVGCPVRVLCHEKMDNDSKSFILKEWHAMPMTILTMIDSGMISDDWQEAELNPRIAECIVNRRIDV